MAKRSTRYELLVDIEIIEGCFTKVIDLMDYIKYRLNLRSRSSDGVLLHNVCVLSEKVNDGQKELLK